METVLMKLLDMSVVSSVLICVVLFLRIFLKKAPAFVRCLLWALVGIRLLVPVGIESPFSLLPSSAPVSSYVESEMPPTETDEGYYTDTAVTTTPVLPDVTETEAEETKNVSPTNVLFYVWMGGVLLMLTYMLGSYAQMRYKVRDALIYDNRVRICTGDIMPFVLGVIAPKIYLPSGLNEEQRSCITMHESAHIKRGDHFIKPLAFLALSVHWFNPLVWTAYLLLCRDIELACDEKVIKNMSLAQRKLYSETLLMCSTRRFGKAMPLAFGEVGVKKRIKKVLYYKKPSFWIICAAFVSVAAIGVFFLTDPQANGTLALENTDDEQSLAESSVYNEESYVTESSADAEESAYESTEESTEESEEVSEEVPADTPTVTVPVAALPYQSTHETPESISQTYAQNDKREHILDEKHPSYVIVWDKETARVSKTPIEDRKLKIWLCDANGNKIDYVYTNSKGIARFEITVEGTYTVRFDGDEKYAACAPSSTYYVTNDLGLNYAILGSDPSVMEKHRNNTVNMYLYDKNEFSPLTVKTYDAATGKPLGNVTVTNGANTHIATVGSSGSVTTASLAAFAGKYIEKGESFGVLRFRKEGYDPCEIYANIEETLIEVYMSPTTNHPYTIKVIDQSTGEPVEGVKLIINALGDNSVIYNEVSDTDGILSGMKTSADLAVSDTATLCYEVNVPNEHGTLSHGIAWCKVRLNKEQSEYTVYLRVGEYPNDISLEVQ